MNSRYIFTVFTWKVWHYWSGNTP